MNCKFGFVALEEQARTKCPARQSTCQKCGKQDHWAAAFKSTVATIASGDDEEVASVLCSSTNEVTKCPHGIYENILIGEDCSPPVRAFINPGSTHSLTRSHV